MTLDRASKLLAAIGIAAVVGLVLMWITTTRKPGNGRVEIATIHQSQAASESLEIEAQTGSGRLKLDNSHSAVDPLSPGLSADDSKISVTISVLAAQGMIRPGEVVVVCGANETTAVSDAGGLWKADVIVPEGAIAQRLILGVHVRSPAFAYQFLSRTVDNELLSAGSSSFTFEMRSGCRLRILVTDDHNQPASDCSVWLNMIQKPVQENQSAPTGVKTSRTSKAGDDGWAVLDGLEPGEWTISTHEMKWWREGESVRTNVSIGRTSEAFLVVRAMERDEYSSGRITLPEGVDPACIKLSILAEDGAEIGNVPIFATEYFVPLETGNSLTVQCVNRCNTRKSQPLVVLGGQHGVTLAAKWP
jgi:hypothetical protein